MPRISNIGTGIQGAKAFKDTVLDYFRRTKDAELKMSVPLVGSHRVARRNLDCSAALCDAEFAREIKKMTDAFLATHPDGIFQAYRFRKPPHINITRRPNSRRRQPTTTMRNRVSADREGVGTVFEVDGTTYCLFRMYEAVAHQGGSCMACAYVFYFFPFLNLHWLALGRFCFKHISLHISFDRFCFQKQF